MESFRNRSFSNSFDGTSSKLIGLYDYANSADSPDFWIIIISAIFHWKEISFEETLQLDDEFYFHF
jgi:hypothetical protein